MAWSNGLSDILWTRVLTIPWFSSLGAEALGRAFSLLETHGSSTLSHLSSTTPQILCLSLIGSNGITCSPLNQPLWLEKCDYLIGQAKKKKTPAVVVAVSWRERQLTFESLNEQQKPGLREKTKTQETVEQKKKGWQGPGRVGEASRITMVHGRR